MKENKWVIALVVLIVGLGGWFVYSNMNANKKPAQEVIHSKEYQDGVALIQQNKLDEAKAALLKGLEKEPQEGKYNFQLGNIERMQNRRQEAVDHYKQSIAKNPTMTEAYINLTGMYMLMEKFDDGLQVTQDGLKKEPTNEDLLFKQGQLYFAKRDFPRALQILEPLIKDDNTPELYRFVGISYLQLKQLDKGIPMLKKYLQLVPEGEKGHAEIKPLLDSIEAMQQQSQ